MDLFQAMQERHSVRSYTDQPIEGEVKEKLEHFIANSETINVPWFGQLMMGPQLLAYFYQIYMWGKIYHVELEL